MSFTQLLNTGIHSVPSQLASYLHFLRTKPFGLTVKQKQGFSQVLLLLMRKWEEGAPKLSLFLKYSISTCSTGLLHPRFCHTACGIITQRSSPLLPPPRDVCQRQVNSHCPRVSCPEDEGHHLRTLNGKSPGPGPQLSTATCRVF